MNASDVPILTIFESKQRFEAPLFQRQYVWSEEHQWRPFWEDIERKFSDYLRGETDAPNHFLGAMVLDQKMTPTGHVVRRQVIDGQQRLTTLQIFLAAFRDYCRYSECDELASECRTFTVNTGMMADKNVDRFKVWPTSQDREQFVAVMTAETQEALERDYPLQHKKYSRKPIPRPRMVEAYLFFYQKIEEFFAPGGMASELCADTGKCDQLLACFSAMQNSLMVVIIDLDSNDDPQVIFETLNARGEALLPADLLRNYIFLRAGRLGLNSEDLYQKYWSGFDEQFWKKEVGRGQLLRPRSDVFLQYYLVKSKHKDDISPKHLYVEYKHWIESDAPFLSIEEELETLRISREHFRRIVEPGVSDPLNPLSEFLVVFDVNSVYPVLLAMLESGVDQAEIEKIASHLESYLMRRAICGLPSRDYRRTFFALLEHLTRRGFQAEEVVRFLASLEVDANRWPADHEFRESWLSENVYRGSNVGRVTYILRRLNDGMTGSKVEKLVFSSQLTVEHLMPQSWVEHWPLPGGSAGLTREALAAYPYETSDSRAVASRQRNALVNTLGNLTLLTMPLNSAVSNGPWLQKRDAIAENSVLAINLPLRNAEKWDEGAIGTRGESLLDLALSLWPYHTGEWAGKNL